MEDSYQLYFDLLSIAPQEFNSKLYLLIIPIGSFLFFLIARLLPNDRKFMVTLVSIGTLALGAFAYLLMVNHEYESQLRTILANNQCEIVAGKIEFFTPLPKTGRGYESFEVKGHKFSYSDDNGRRGFGKTRTFGGNILADGMQVRICHFDRRILRLELTR